MIPIVFPIAADPVGDGLVASLARPGGNVTGSSALAAQINPKRLQLLQETVPGLSRVAWLWNTGVGAGEGLRPMEESARSLGLKLQSLAIRGSADFESAFDAATSTVWRK